MNIITPTIGRKVWFRPSYMRSGMSVMNNNQPLDATIVYVWNDRMVNLLVTDHVGITFPLTSVVLLQPGDTPYGEYCEWMPYQQGKVLP